ncbi:hypothetical protein UA08_01527 [Talaromyces atroroseus]|uniref:CFEM domain-containing protein n=1 Tax=Talaromyces atroroseus TaxID=1441469 RepID=A0A1Q5QAJ6_TALAT|nr:hypothetical protein UA08_01527 [Talaromyces atroroseus]OKL62789.1 hypothetical protein UA08_01527 [Talaromyces atroroseus]
MRFSSIGALATFSVIHRISAGDWDTENCFPVPRNCDNKCTGQQQTGWDWSGLTLGQSVSNYDGFGFSGFTCSNSGRPGIGKRDADKCISGTISKPSGAGSAPKITCGDDIDAFSITSFNVYVDTATDVSFNFGMPDGSNCQFTTSCGIEGTHVSNDQCGGATSVSWSIPDTSNVDSCGFGIYSIGFDCSPGIGSSHTTTGPTTSKTIPPILPNTATSSLPAQSVTVPAPSTTESPSFTANLSETTPVSVVSSTSSSKPAVSTAAGSTISVTEIFTPSTIYTTTEVTITSCAPTVTNCPANSHSVITQTVAVSTTLCPVTAAETGQSTVIPAAQTGSTGSSPSSTSPSSATHSPSSSSPSSSNPNFSATSSPGNTSPGSCPSVVPKCINTWLPSTCTDNTDVSCFCPSSNTTSSIISCIQAWSSDSSEKSTALSYFTGICSGYVSTNPGIVTGVPSTITLAPTPAPSTSSSGISTIATVVGGGTATALPYTTITYSSSTYIVPQVIFTTVTSTGVSATTTSVGLVAVTSAPANQNPVSTTLATSRSIPGVAGATGYRTPSPSSTLTPFTGAAVPGASISSQDALLTVVMGLLAFFL